MELKEVLESKIYVNEVNNITFASPKEYLNPFIDIVGDDNIVVVGTDKIVNKNEDDTENVSYARVRIEKRLDTHIINQIGELQPLVGMIYALDISNPIIKVYSGLNVKACNNLNVFNADDLYQVDLLSNYRTAYDYAKIFFKGINNLVENYNRIIEQMKDTKILKKDYYTIMGNLLTLGLKHQNLGTTPIVRATKLLEDKKSIYYFHNEGNNNIWNIYNAATDYISSSPEYKEHPNKSLTMFNLLKEAQCLISLN
jgi:hypothetical protein